MNILPSVKNIFSHLAFFNTERTIKEIKHQFELRDKAYRGKLHCQEQKIDTLKNKVQHLEYEKKEGISELKTLFKRNNYLHRKLEHARDERDKARQNLLSAIHLKHKVRAKIPNRN